jgi:hypothetical protein
MVRFTIFSSVGSVSLDHVNLQSNGDVGSSLTTYFALNGLSNLFDIRYIDSFDSFGLRREPFLLLGGQHSSLLYFPINSCLGRFLRIGCYVVLGLAARCRFLVLLGTRGRTE